MPPYYCFKYKDSDDELITLSNEEDYDTAILTSEQEKLKTLRVYIETTKPEVPESVVVGKI